MANANATTPTGMYVIPCRNMCVRACADQAQWAKDLACELLRISTPLSRGRRGQINTENGGVCQQYTQNAFMYVQTHSTTPWGTKLGEKKGEHCRSLLKTERVYLFNCISGYMWVCLCSWQHVHSYVWSVCALCTRACEHMCTCMSLYVHSVVSGGRGL